MFEQFVISDLFIKCRAQSRQSFFAIRTLVKYTIKPLKGHQMFRVAVAAFVLDAKDISRRDKGSLLLGHVSHYSARISQRFC